MGTRSVLAFNPSDDGAAALMADGELVYPLEGEKDLFERNAPLPAQTTVQGLSHGLELGVLNCGECWAVGSSTTTLLTAAGTPGGWWLMDERVPMDAVRRHPDHALATLLTGDDPLTRTRGARAIAEASR